jgi:hypothetical protein
MKLTLPKTNLTKPKSGEHNIEQLCVIENTKDNRQAIKRINKLARQQGSRYKIKSKYRCAIDKSQATKYGSIKSENAKGIGLYIKLTDEAMSEDRKRAERNAEYVNTEISEDHKMVLNKCARLYDENTKLLNENRKLKKQLEFQKLTFEQQAIYIIDKEVEKWQENNCDEDYFNDYVNRECVNIEINTILDNLKNKYDMK